MSAMAWTMVGIVIGLSVAAPFAIVWVARRAGTPGGSAALHRQDTPQPAGMQACEPDDGGGPVT